MAQPKPQKVGSGDSKIRKTKRDSKKQSPAYDPALATLFENSLGPVKNVTKTLPLSASIPVSKVEVSSQDESTGAEEIEDNSGSRTSTRQPYEATSDHRSPRLENSGNSLARPVNRKRKRRDVEDDVEGRYLNQLAREEAKEHEHKASEIASKHQKCDAPVPFDRDDTSNSEDESESRSVGAIHDNGKENVSGDVPQHEIMLISREDLDLEKASRTVFLANVSTLTITSKTAKKTLLDHLASFTPSLSQQNTKHGVESLRFRSTAFASSGVPRKAAYAKKELMDTTTKSTNAYAVYTTQVAAREATKRLNGTKVLDRHLRVDSVAHPAKTDHRRCVFIGNLGFVDNETNMNAVEDEENGKRPRKPKEPADVEEGLWRQFGKAGTVESVRVVRDKTTRVGKGFAYVQFEDANAVEKALLYNEKRFPPMLPRILRVIRAKNVKKAAGYKEKRAPFKRKGDSTAAYNPRIPSQVQSMTGRAGKLLGRAGAAKIRVAGEMKHGPSFKANSVAKSPESIVFEGYRASRLQGKGALKMRGSGKTQGKPRTRSSRRGADFKAKGRKKAG